MLFYENFYIFVLLVIEYSLILLQLATLLAVVVSEHFPNDYYYIIKVILTFSCHYSYVEFFCKAVFEGDV